MDEKVPYKESIFAALAAVESLILMANDKDYRVLNKILSETTNLQIYYVLKLISKAQREVLLDQRNNKRSKTP